MKNVKVNNNGFTEMTGFFAPMMSGLFISFLSMIIFSVIVSIAIKYSLLELSSAKMLSSVILFLGGFFGTYFGSKKYGRNGMIFGISLGIVILLFIIVVGLIFGAVSFEMVDFSLFFIKLFGLMLFGAIGGIIGINTNSSY